MIDESRLQEQSSLSRLRPACLPLTGPSSASHGIHAGWSTPPSREVIRSLAAQYLPFYREFFKLWHFNMELMTCRDPTVYAIWPNNSAVQFPSNTFYPPGTLCAQDISFGFCPSSGESGSPLMTRRADGSHRFVVEGILSFTKGCSAFLFRQRNPLRSELLQRSVNPTVYTRLACFLPWVAKQYDMDLPASIDSETGCSEGQGDPGDQVEDICRNAPTLQEEPEVPCIFPFYLGINPDLSVYEVEG